MKKETFIKPEGKREYTLYLLELENDRYYVGVTSQNPERRLEQHLEGTMGSKWTRKYKPVNIAHTEDLGVMNYDAACTKEDWYTIQYAREYGIDNVRGGKFCRLTLTKKYIVAVEQSPTKAQKKKSQIDHKQKLKNMTALRYENRDNLYYRYKKPTAPVDENPEKNGEVTIVTPARKLRLTSFYKKEVFTPLPKIQENRLEGWLKVKYFSLKHPNKKKVTV